MLFQSDNVRHKFPLRATYFRQVLPHVRRFLHARSTMPDKTPQGHAAGLPFHGYTSPPCIGVPCRSSGSGLACVWVSPVRASISVYLVATFPTGRSQWGFPSSRNISSCMPWPVDSGGSIHPRLLRMESCCLRSPLSPRHPQHPSFEAVPALQGARTPLRPARFSVYASPVLFASQQL